MAVIGDKELESNSLSIRTRASGELGAMPITDVIEKLKVAIAEYVNF
jgi:threonyl-tRNA synthetase